MTSPRVMPPTDVTDQDRRPGCQPIDPNHPERFYLPPSAGVFFGMGEIRDGDGFPKVLIQYILLSFFFSNRFSLIFRGFQVK